ncbi:tetratricopeptide repeat protein [Janthinobacterium sp. PC23-8]|uniref:tetratricopeptide repeat protein n=1 Tax=Janthinobacterium sp. PC23-8 TaxID=2012679 RepID=UPI000B95D2E5|nr:tetratricopeptide repeat protein [Janthinobacterium sp. PC23-8]OYO30253.1 hypothetical protein CD932_03245 [Janthinobacterium sp. PC23-8]
MSMTSHYNPDWLSDDALLANFVARQHDFTFLRDELSHASLEGNVQHYLLVGVRGAGKTTLLKRLAVAIRRDTDLNAHLIALSFPEEMYQVKNLADFWWAACDALADELDFLKREGEADDLMAAIATARRNDDRNNPVSDVAFKLLQQTCARLKLRPVMLVDNLDMVFQRIDKNGRKLNDPHAPAYWALREALSTSTSPIVIGGSVRLSAPFKDYDKAFYDFFLPKRLGKLSLDEARLVLDRLSEAQRLPDLQERLRARPGRIEALFELTGGNPRALGLIFELLRSGPNSRAVEDFERLMDITTPYYKARIEDLSEQAQVIMHALAVYGIAAADGLRFGHTAAEIGGHSGLPTTTVSAQLAILENEGLVEKSADHGRTQYRIAEQLFRLWLQMRGTRRIRQNVIGLTKFFEAMYDANELREKLKEDCGASALADAKFAFAVAAMQEAASHRGELEAFGTDRLQSHVRNHGGNLDEYLPSVDVYPSASLDALPSLVFSAKFLIEKGILACRSGNFSEAENAFRQATISNERDPKAWIYLANLLSGSLNRYEEAEFAYRKAIEIDSVDFPWLLFGMLLDLYLQRFDEAEKIYRKAIESMPLAADPWLALGAMLTKQSSRYEEAEAALRKAIELNPSNVRSWLAIGDWNEKLQLYEEAEASYRKAKELDESSVEPLISLGCLLILHFSRLEEAEIIFRDAVRLAPNEATTWNLLGLVLEMMGRDQNALSAYDQGAILHSNQIPEWKERRAEIRLRLRLKEVCQSIHAGEMGAVKKFLSHVLEDAEDIAEVLISKNFVEGFLVPLLSQPNTAVLILFEMRQSGYEQHAKPLILAFEAAIEGRADMLAELEPEVQGATRRMFDRLTATQAKPNTPA